jgi:hypothetical protein
MWLIFFLKRTEIARCLKEMSKDERPMRRREKRQGYLRSSDQLRVISHKAKKQH